MIALRATQPEPQPRHVERGRDAARRRAGRARRRGYATFARVAAALALVVGPVLVYVMLVANLTSLSFKLARVQAQRTSLVAQTMRQEDRIAKLESRERLAALAARLHMHDPRAYAVVVLPPPPHVAVTPHGIALLGAMNQWFTAPAPAVAR